MILLSVILEKEWDQDHLSLYGMISGSQPHVRDQQIKISIKVTQIFQLTLLLAQLRELGIYRQFRL